MREPSRLTCLVLSLADIDVVPSNRTTPRWDDLFQLANLVAEEGLAQIGVVGFLADRVDKEACFGTVESPMSSEAFQIISRAQKGVATSLQAMKRRPAAHRRSARRSEQEAREPVMSPALAVKAMDRCLADLFYLKRMDRRWMSRVTQIQRSSRIQPATIWALARSSSSVLHEQLLERWR